MSPAVVEENARLREEIYRLRVQYESGSRVPGPDSLPSYPGSDIGSVHHELGRNKDSFN